MRFLTVAAMLGLLAAPAYAQTTTTAPGNSSAGAAPAATAPAPSTSESTTTPAAGSAHGSAHASLDKRFADANTTHDGHLTKEQAEAAGNLKNVVKHFDAMDADHKGYVTIDDIHKFNHARRAARRAAKTQKSES
jgi:hypothetical protein